MPSSQEAPPAPHTIPASGAAPPGRWRAYFHRERFFFLFAIIVGVVAGLAVVCFRLSIDWVTQAVFGSHPGTLRLVLGPALAGLLIAALVVKVAPEARGSGVNQTKAALYIYDGFIAFRTVLVKFIGSALAVGSGQSLGPEDPSLQVGAGLASWMGRKLRVSRARLRLLAPLGAAAGLAAAFNAPIGAVLFVIEEVIGRWSSGVIGAVVLSAAAGTVVSRVFLGTQPLFSVSHFELRDPRELFAYAALGAIGGFASLAFVKLVAWLRPALRRLPHPTQYVQPAAAGLILGFIGLRFPQVLGSGYGAIDQLMLGHYVWTLLAALAALKIVATALSFSSGAPGGMFAPTLFIGAMMGGALGGLQHRLLPHFSAPAAAYALVGMGVAFAGILRAPMTSIFLVVEVSGSYDIIVPLMISNTIAYFVSRRFQPTPIFELLTRQDGIELPSMEELRDEQVLHVEDAMHPPRVPVESAWRTVSELLGSLRADGRGFLLVRAGPHAWAGLTPARLERLAEQGQGDRRLEEVLPLDAYLPLLYPDQPLEAFLREAGDLPLLPVVHRADGSLLGVVSLTDVLAAYRASGAAPVDA